MFKQVNYLFLVIEKRYMIRKMRTYPVQPQFHATQLTMFIKKS
jgi:hypothetical protein